MLVMPLRITHVDTKVLVFLVQAMPTSLHTACAIPLNRRTGRQSPAKRSGNNEVISCDCAAMWYPKRRAVISKDACVFLVMVKRRLVSNIYRWGFPLSIHCKSSSAPVALVDQENRRDAERPAAANGKDGEDWQPSLLRIESPGEWISADHLHRPSVSYTTLFCPNSDVFAQHRPQTVHLIVISSLWPIRWSRSADLIWELLFFTLLCTSEKKTHFLTNCDVSKRTRRNRGSCKGSSHETDQVSVGNEGVVGSCYGSGSAEMHRMQWRGGTHLNAAAIRPVQREPHRADGWQQIGSPCSPLTC